MKSINSVQRLENRSIRLISYLIICTLFFTACSKQAPNIKSYDEYKIGVAAPQFGPYQALGLSIIHGAEIAVNETNSMGGINGKQIELIKIDDGGLAGEGTWKAKTLVSEMVLGVVGHLNSDISIPASEIYAEAMIPQISPGSTNPLFTERKDVRGYVFRTIGRDDGQAKIATDFIKKHSHKKIGILYNNRSYGNSLATELKKHLKTVEGTNVVFDKMYMVGQGVFTDEVAELTKAQPTFLFFVGEYGDAGKFLKQSRAKGFNGTFLGSEGVFDKEFIAESKGSANGAYVISYPPIRKRDFGIKYKKTFNRDLGSFSAASYDATNILINAINNADKKIPSEVAKKVSETKDYPGLAENITFDSKGDVLHQPFSIYKVLGEHFLAVK